MAVYGIYLYNGIDFEPDCLGLDIYSVVSKYSSQSDLDLFGSCHDGESRPKRNLLFFWLNPSSFPMYSCIYWGIYVFFS
jgi:hypothetical protein